MASESIDMKHNSLSSLVYPKPSAEELGLGSTHKRSLSALMQSPNSSFQHQQSSPNTRPITQKRRGSVGLYRNSLVQSASPTPSKLPIKHNSSSSPTVTGSPSRNNINNSPMKDSIYTLTPQRSRSSSRSRRHSLQYGSPTKISHHNRHNSYLSANTTFNLDNNLSGINNHGKNGIKVIARFRPENEHEINFNDERDAEVEELINGNHRQGVIEFQSDTSIYYNYKDQAGSFTFDRIFQPNSTQQEIFDYSIHETVEDIFQGYNGTILAYGQTGSGKTYTMMGNDIEDKEHQGLIPRISDKIFEMILTGSSDIEYTVGVSYMEIYMEKIVDLISDSNNHSNDPELKIVEDKENGIHVRNLKKIYVTSPTELYDLMKQGSVNRSTASTNMNEESSRSHAIFQIMITQKVISSGIIKKGSLFLVDLAGSEKITKTGASGQTLEEAKKINSSLSSLGNVINALTDGKSQHIPYRDSKLTRILQESLGGNSRTSLIINCSPSKYNALETLSTLRFGSRAKKIKNKPHVNAELSPNELKRSLIKITKENKSKDEFISSLIQELENWRNNCPPSESDWLDLNDNENNKNKFNKETKRNSMDSFNNSFEDFNDSKNSIDEEVNVELGMMIKENQELNEKLKIMKIKDEIINKQKNDLNYLKNKLELEKMNNLTMNEELNELKNKLKKSPIGKTEKKRLLALEKSLDHLSNQLKEMSLQNVILKKDITTTRSIAETRNERIKSLEMVVNSQRRTVDNESIKFQKKLDSLSERILHVKKFQNENGSRSPTIYNNLTSPVSDSRFNYSSILSPKSPIIYESSFENENLINNISNSLNHPKLLFDTRITSENLQPKKGLNLRIIKPLRGGGGKNSKNDSDIENLSPIAASDSSPNKETFIE